MDRNKLLKRSLSRIEKKINGLNKRSTVLSWIRLTVVMIGVLFIILALIFSNEILSWIALFNFVFVFGYISLIHKRLKNSIKKHEIWQSIKNEHLHRLMLDWAKIPKNSYKTDNRHPFAIDLDITGENSLHRLIDNTSTVNGSELLLDWLLETNPDPQIITSRQNLVKILIPWHRFRDKLTLQSQIISAEAFDGRRFMDWLNKLNAQIPGKMYIFTLISLAVLNIILFSLNYAGLIPAYYTISFIIYVMVYLAKIKVINRMFWQAIALNDEIRKISRTLVYLEKYPIPENNAVTKLLGPFRIPGEQPSRYVNKLIWLLGIFGFRANIVIQVAVNIILPADYILTMLFTDLKDKIRKTLPGWLNCWYELEALNALANFAWLNPEYTFPAYNPNGGILKALKLGHPLISKDIKKVNDFEIRNTGDIVLITGSNMSGKSTFLRTVGINICLAQAGSVVNAKSIQLMFVRLYTCIKISDNLSEGLSYFYAEVKRLKALLKQLDQSSPYPLFYLIDEIYKGTNNQERLTGSRAYIKSLEKKYGAGIVSTHDLELTGLEAEIPSLKNFHFQEHIEDSRMIFDFKLRQGPCPTTNALIIMKNEGLPTD